MKTEKTDPEIYVEVGICIKRQRLKIIKKTQSSHGNGFSADVIIVYVSEIFNAVGHLEIDRFTVSVGAYISAGDRNIHSVCSDADVRFSV